MIDENKVVAEFINLYTKFKANGKWDKHTTNKDATIIALATAFKATKEAAATPNEQPKGPIKSNDNQSKGPPAWKCTKDGPYINCLDSGKRFK